MKYESEWDKIVSLSKKYNINGYAVFMMALREYLDYPEDEAFGVRSVRGYEDQFKATAKYLIERERDYLKMIKAGEQPAKSFLDFVGDIYRVDAPLIYLAGVIAIMDVIEEKLGIRKEKNGHQSIGTMGE